jgi:hypothetical protein
MFCYPESYVMSKRWCFFFFLISGVRRHRLRFLFCFVCVLMELLSFLLLILFTIHQLRGGCSVKSNYSYCLDGSTALLLFCFPHLLLVLADDDDIRLHWWGRRTYKYPLPYTTSLVMGFCVGAERVLDGTCFSLLLCFIFGGFRLLGFSFCVFSLNHLNVYFN